MKKKKRQWSIVLIVLGFVLALGSGAAVFLVLMRAEERTPEIARTPVVIAWQPIPARHEISAEEVAVINWPLLNDFPLPPGTYVDPNEVIGKLTSAPIGQGEAIISSSLIDKARAKGSGANASYVLDQGTVAVALPLSLLSSVANGIQPGDRVDVIATFSTPENDAAIPDPARKTATHHTLQNLLVLQVGSWSSPTKELKLLETQPAQASVVTLQVTAQEAEVLKYIESMSDSWSFILRPIEDQQYYQTVPVTLDFINRNYGYEFPLGK